MMTALVDHKQFETGIEPETLLPSNAQPFERHMALTMARLSRIPVPIDTLMDADRCPAAFLPWLAWALSVDIWDETWPEEKKRSIIRRSVHLHRIKGTLAGIRAYVEEAGGELYSYVRPPAKNFLGASITREEREAFLETLPQVRIYSSKRRGQAGAQAFFGRPGRPYLWGSYFTDDHGRSLVFAAVTDTADRLRNRATYVHEGVEQELTWSTADGTGERVYLKGKSERGVFCGQPAGKHFVESTASRRIVTLDLDRTSAADRLLYRFPVVPKLQPVHASPLRVYERGAAAKSVFCGTTIGRRYFAPTGARYRIYDAVHLRLPDMNLQGRQALNYMGTQRFGQPAFCAELSISVMGRRPRWIADRFVGGYFYTAPQKALKKALAAVRASKSHRDEILVNPQTYRPLLAGTPLYLGAPLIAGSMTRS